jgi:protein-tyrosine phosphatase
MQSDAHEIIPRLWLGNKRAAANGKWLASNNINVVMNCSKDIPFSEDNPQRRFYRIPIDDSLRDVDINYLSTASEEVAYTLLREYKSGSIILVHCAAGMQRSAASVAMFLMTLFRWPAKKAIDYIKGIRPIAFTPGVNFERSLKYYEMKLFREIIPTVEKYHIKSD